MDDVLKIPGYRIEKKLGEGGMSVVYLGTLEKVNLKVAVKVLDPTLLRNKTIEKRFLQEAETTANMYHSNIISIFASGRAEKYIYIVMEYLEETLKDYLLSSPGFTLKPEKALEVIKPILGALEYAHSRGIVHRDIKSENIMFRSDGTPVLTDFGIARALDSDIHVTRTGMSVGTPYYMSPEQCKAEALDGRSDIYSLGVVLFEILTGHKPYQADNPMGVALKHVQAPVPRLPEALLLYQPLIDKMMAKRKEDRAANGKELLKLMNAVLKQAKESAVLFTALPGTGPAPVNLPPSGSPTEIELTAPLLGVKAVPVGKPPPAPPPEPLDEFDLAPTPPPKPGPAPVSVSESVPPVFKKSIPLQRKYPVKKIVKTVLGLLTTPSHSLSQQGPQYQADYNQALALYNKGDYEKALAVVKGLKESKSIPEVDQLEEKIGQKLQEADFNA